MLPVKLASLSGDCWMLDLLLVLELVLGQPQRQHVSPSSSTQY
ncbi:MAG TPA: hypothetical protein VF981_14260 [Gemmatimonadaceae bacterium]